MFEIGVRRSDPQWRRRAKAASSPLGPRRPKAGRRDVASYVLEEMQELDQQIACKKTFRGRSSLASKAWTSCQSLAIDLAPWWLFWSPWPAVSRYFSTPRPLFRPVLASCSVSRALPPESLRHLVLMLLTSLSTGESSNRRSAAVLSASITADEGRSANALSRAHKTLNSEPGLAQIASFLSRCSDLSLFLGHAACLRLSTMRIRPPSPCQVVPWPWRSLASWRSVPPGLIASCASIRHALRRGSPSGYLGWQCALSSSHYTSFILTISAGMNRVRAF